MTLTPSPVRITPIDSLRGMAALWVANFHFSFFTGIQPQGGYLCVDLFFILSGIVLTHVYEHKIVHGHITFAHFFVNRMARLYPLHLLTFLMMVAITVVVMRHAEHPQVSSLLFTGALNLVLLQNVGLTPEALAWNVPAWSISTEIVINFIWFLFLFSLRRTTLGFCVAIVGAIALLFVGQGSSYNITCENVFVVINGGLLRCTVGFFLGCLLYRWLIGTGILQKLASPVVNLVSLLVLAALFAAFYEHARLVPMLVDYGLVLILFPLLILCSLHHRALLSHALQLRAFRYLGDISYSVYLLHWPLGILLTHAQIHWPKIQGPIWGFAFFAVLIPVSALSFHYIEMPLRDVFKYRS